MNEWRLYFRYLGFRKLLALAACWPIVIAFRAILAGVPPAAFYSWPPSAKVSLECLIEASFSVAFAAWCWFMTQPIVWIRVPAKRHAAWFARAAICGSMALPALASLLRGLVLMVFQDIEVALAIIGIVARIVALPIAVGLLPLLAIDVVERVKTIRVLHRWRTAGTGPHASWVAPYVLKRSTRPLPGRWQWW